MQLCLDMRTGAGCGTENPNYVKECSTCHKDLRFALTLKDPKTLVGRYRIVRVIGYGAYGAVYEAHKRYEPTRPVALKETFDASSISTFEREFSVLSGLDHPNLPRYIEMFEAQGNGYLVMEYVAGQSLQEILDSSNDFSRSGPRTTKVVTTESQVLGYALQLCDVLEYLHSQQPPILHRDIKPANIRLTPEGRIKLVDFGLLKQAGYQTRATIRGLGTAAYAPLEQYGDNQQVTDVRSDIYSLGTTLYHLFSGQEPLSAPNRFAGDSDPLPPLPPEVSFHVRPAVMKAMSLMARDRFASISHFRQALVGGQSVGADVAEAEQPSLTHSPETKEIEIPPESSLKACEGLRHKPFKLDKPEIIIEALRTNPQNTRAWLILGWMMAKEGKPEQARQCYERALKINLQSYEGEALWALPAWVDLVTAKEEVPLISNDLYPSASRSSVRRDNDPLPTWLDEEQNRSFFSPLQIICSKHKFLTALSSIFLLSITCLVIYLGANDYRRIFALSFMTVPLMAFIFYGLKWIQLLISSRYWPASEAIVIGSFIKRYESKGKLHYIFYVVCAYPVDQHIYYSLLPSENRSLESIYETGRNQSDHEFQQKEKEYNFARPMTVFYNPRQPDMVLNKISIKRFLSDLTISLLFSLYMGLGLCSFLYELFKELTE